MFNYTSTFVPSPVGKIAVSNASAYISITNFIPPKIIHPTAANQFFSHKNQRHVRE
jgi:hypothetical protein